MKTILTLALMGAVALGAMTLTSCGKDGGDDSKPQYTVTFDADGGTPVPAAQKVKEGETATVPPAVTRAGYAFLFWSAGGSTAYDFATPVTANITLTARWQAEATVEYWQVAWELNGGAWPAGDNHATQVVRGGTLAEPAAPTRGGYTFEGWYREAALTNRVSFPYDVSAVTANFTLYAKWAGGGVNTDPEGNVSTVEQLRTALKAGGKKTIRLAAGDYTVTAITETSNYPLLATTANSEIIILPPASGTATIKASADTNRDVLQVGNNSTLTLGQEGGGEGKIVIDGSAKSRGDSYNAPGYLVYVWGGGKLVLHAGVTLSGNSSSGVNIDNGCEFEMKGGTISNNRSSISGAGVLVRGKFVMEGGTISGNTAFETGACGGGVAVGLPGSSNNSGSFIMRGGTIMKNVASRRGGGVYVVAKCSFLMEGGTIYGSGHSDANRAGASINTTGNGHAVYRESGATADYGNGVAFATATDNTVTGRK